MAWDGIRRCCATGETTGGGGPAFKIGELSDAFDGLGARSGSGPSYLLGAVPWGWALGFGMGLPLSHYPRPTSGSTKRRSRLRLMPWSDFAPPWPVT